MQADNTVEEDFQRDEAGTTTFEVENNDNEEQPIDIHLNVHKQHSDLAIDSKQRAYSEADEIVVGGGGSNKV